VIGDNIRIARVKKGLPASTVAVDLGVSHTAYGRYESNQVDVRTEQVFKLAEILEVTVAELMGLPTEKNIEVLEAELAACKEENRILWKRTANYLEDVVAAYGKKDKEPPHRPEGE